MISRFSRFRSAALFALALCVGYLGGHLAAPALAADADLQQYNVPAANAQSANAANALTGSMLLVTDGKLIAADSAAAGKAAVNRSVKQLADRVRQSLFGI